jgi:hypothetical protein
MNLVVDRRPGAGALSSRGRAGEDGLALVFQGSHVLLGGHHGAGRDEGAVGDL